MRPDISGFLQALIRQVFIYRGEAVDYNETVWGRGVMGARCGRIAEIGVRLPSPPVINYGGVLRILAFYRVKTPR